MRVLVVEDDFISRRLLCRYLQAHGECDVAVNGNEAVGAFKQVLLSKQHYDLVCNTERMSPETAAELLLALLRKRLS